MVKVPLAENEQAIGAPYSGYAYHRYTSCPVCSEPKRREWLVRNCGLVANMLTHRLAHWKSGLWPPGQQDRHIQRERAKAAIEAAIETKRGLYTFHGDFGSGKTYALAVICNELRDQMCETYYAPLPHILDHLRSLYARDEDTSSYWQRLLDVPVLALDEITRFKATEWAEEKVFVLADQRYRRRDTHLTLFATNDDPTGASYLFSRMRDGVLVELRGDMRGS